jgi:hypothetical protein
MGTKSSSMQQLPAQDLQAASDIKGFVLYQDLKNNPSTIQPLSRANLLIIFESKVLI